MTKKRKNKPQPAQNEQNKPNTDSRQSTAADAPEAAIDTQQHKSELYVREMSVAVMKISAALNRLMTDTFFNVFWESEQEKAPGKLEEFFFPLFTKNIILDRARFLKVCDFDTRDRAEKTARAFKESSLPIVGRDYQNIPDKDFEAVIREEFEKNHTDVRRVRSYFDSMDLQACCKSSREIYKKLREAGLLGEISENSWSKLCRDANEARNFYGGHTSPGTIKELRDKGGPQLELRPWFQAAELLRSEKYNPTTYGPMRSAWDKAKELHESIRSSKVFLFRDLLRVLQDRGLDGLTESDLRSAAQFQDIICDASCAVYNGTGEELARLLEQGVRAGTRIPLKDLEEYFGDDINAVEDIEAYMEGLGVPVLDGTVLGRSKEEVMALLSKRKERITLEEARPDQQTEEAVDESWKQLPMLRELAEYQGGPLSQSQINELLMTHQLVLDASVLLSEAGRTFLARVLVDRLKRMRGRGQEILLMMDATTRYHMLYECERCKQAERIYLSTDWSRRREPERQEQARQIEAMSPAKAAYYFAQDVLRREGLLRYIGIPDPGRDGREMLRMLLEENPSRRFCVLTCGASPLAEDIGRARFPLCAVARIQGDYYSEQGKKPGPNCLIFDKYLPLAKGFVPVDYDRDLRETLRLAGETYNAGGEPKDEAEAREASE